VVGGEGKRKNPPRIKAYFLYILNFVCRGVAQGGDQSLLGEKGKGKEKKRKEEEKKRWKC